MTDKEKWVPLSRCNAVGCSNGLYYMLSDCLSGTIT
jgi:hypothetical protein